MADKIKKYCIPLSNRKDFNNWKFRMENLLSKLELIEFVSTAAENKGKEAQKI